MTEDQVREMAQAALPHTSAREAIVSFVVNDGSAWIVVLQSKGEELAVKLSAEPDSTADSLRDDFIRQVRKLF